MMRNIEALSVEIRLDYFILFFFWVNCSSWISLQFDLINSRDNFELLGVQSDEEEEHTEI